MLKQLFSIAITFLITIPLYILSIESGPNDILYSIGPNSLGNIIFYMRMIVLNILLFLIAYIILLLVGKKITLNEKTKKTTVIVSYFLLIVEIIIMYLYFQNRYVLFSILVVVIVCLVINCKKIEQYSNCKVIILIEYASVIAICLLAFHFIGVYTAFGDMGHFNTWYNVHHSSAVLDSIYNAYYGIPYGYDSITEQYGHYSLFFYPLLKITGLKFLMISLSFGGITLLLVLCLYYFVKTVVHNAVIRIMFVLLCLMSFVLLCGSNLYWQTTPIRLFFPSLMLAHCARMIKKDNYGHFNIIVGCVLSFLSLLWNTESGLVVIVTWIVFMTVTSLQKKRIGIKLISLCLIQSIIVIVLSVLFEYGAVNLFNIVMSDYSTDNLITLRMLIGGVTLDEEYMKNLGVPLEWYNESLFMVFIFISLLLYSITRTRVFGKLEKTEVSKAAPLIATVSITGLGILTYYFYRTAGGTIIACPFYYAALTILLYFAINKIKETKIKVSDYNFITIIAIVILCSSTIIAHTVSGYDDGIMNIEKRQNSGFYDNEEYWVFIEEIRSNVDENAYGVGIGVSEIYMDLNWTNKTKYFSPVGLDPFNYEKSLFINMELSEYLSPKYTCETYKCVRTFEYKGISFGYYVIE